MNLNDIDTSTKEGKLLMGALVILTMSPKLIYKGEEVNGRTKSPDDALSMCREVALACSDDYAFKLEGE